ncbi:sugar-binding protein [Puniceicoccus vermicola]|uniref:Cellulase family glycosylhydrolase n=1 Tax=Puniceicoccus vermicola TaxID=388746 RepID=A0A7X1AZF4_9BACT|nr:sugar-binding protein [Puniceicoccus vermicola]MBC2602800.1 cellulase family glycosylhydrolase [Puniceicoccus vermicola]
MKKIHHFSLCLLLLLSSSAISYSAKSSTTASTADVDDLVVSQAPEDALADPADLVVWDEQRFPRFAKGSVADADSWLNDGKPAGAHGALLTNENGNLEFEDGTPVRFWGTTLAYGASFPENDKQIEVIADSIAANGYNVVRFHHNDHIWTSVSFLKSGSVFELDPERIAIIDKLMKAFIDRGIYIYLDLIDQRGWTEEIGIEDWEELAKKDNYGWKGVFPMPVMVEAWKRATSELINHVNPYTGKSLAEDPAVICIEIINENGPFWDWAFKTPPSVQEWFDAAWNAWLLERYGDRENLAEVWTDASGTSGLFDNEDPAKGNVYRPQLQVLNNWKRSYRSKARGAARYNDLIAFYREISTEFYLEASEYLRESGFEGQIIGSHELRGPQNQLAEIEGTNSISVHLYGGDQIAFSARPGNSGITVDGVDVSTKNWFTNMARINVDGYPGWNNEWTAGGLAYRADAHLAIAAMMGFQGIDGSVHFTWSQLWGGERMPNKDITYNWIEWRKKFHKSFTTLHDSPSMAIHRIAAAIMRRSDIPPARYTAQIAHSAEDVAEQNLHAVGLEGGGGTIGNAAQFLPMLHRTETTFFDETYGGDADVVFSTGRTASGNYSQARHAVILGDNPWNDRYHKKRDLAAPARELHPELVTQNLDTPTTFTLNFGYEAPLEVTFKTLEAAIEVSSLPDGATPIGLSADRRHTLGWCDDQFLVFPAAGQFDRLGKDPRWLFRFYLTAAKRWDIDLGPNSMDTATYYSDNGALQTDWGTGTLLINSPRTQAISGYPGLRPTNATDNLATQLDRPYGTIALTSTDGAPIAKSKRMLMVAAGRIQNTGTVYTTGDDNVVRITKVGSAPILIEGLHGRVALTNLERNDLNVYALDVEGRRIGEVPVERRNGQIIFSLNPGLSTLWFEIAAPSISAPTSDNVSNWPAPFVPTPEATDPPRLSVAEYTALLSKKTNTEVEEENADTNPDGYRIELTYPSEFKSYQAYGNLTATSARHDKEDVVDLVFGQHTQEWHAGAWFETQSLPGLKPEDCKAISFYFKGDGTLPRDCHVTITWTDNEGKNHKAKSRNLNTMFEDPEWREIQLTASDFPDQEVDFSRIQRLEFTVVSNLITNRHNARIGGFQLLTNTNTEKAKMIENLSERMPTAQQPTTGKIVLPLHSDVKITTDGDPSETAWNQSTSLSVDEDNVPSWQNIGSVLVTGNRKGEEKADIWMLATPQGLALYIAVDKNGAPIVNEGEKWYEGDCIELFIDKNNSKTKPSKQLFFAYKRPGINRATSLTNSASLGRMRTPEGYTMEILIPWGELGIKPQPGTTFGIDFQISFGDASGRYLQYSYATGTNETWFSSSRYLEVTLAE